MKALYGIGMRKGLTAFVFIVLHMSAFGGNGPRFIENKGQYPKQVSHHLRVANADVFFQKDRLVFNFSDPELLGGHDHATGHEHEHRPNALNAHAYHIVFQNASSQAHLKGESEYADRTHFLRGNDPSKWATDVRAFARLHYSGIYPGIDLHYFEQDGNLKYEFMVGPNSDASAIAMTYEGVDDIYLKQGQLHVVNRHNHVTELRPVAYQVVDGVKRDVPCHFVLAGQTVRFAFPNGYDPNEELVIDPVLIFSSYSGSVSNNFGFTATYDDGGALYGGGITFGANYPFVTGSYNNGFGGQVDMAITKFSPDGSSLIYSTIIGGVSADAPNSMVVNSAGRLVILGSTSSSDFPVTAGAYDVSYNGGVAVNYPSNGTDYTTGSDIVVVVLEADGSSIVGSTFLGGSGNDGLNQSNILTYNYGDQFRGEVIVDAADNIFIASSTLSADLPVTPGVFGQALSGAQDAVVAKFDPNVGGLQWCSYLGGGGADAGYSLKLGSLGDVFVAGGTQGQNFPVTGGTLHPTYMGGTTDGFIARILADGSSIQRASYIGTSAYDQAYLVEIDGADNVYLYGQSLGAIPVTSGVYSNTGGRQFIQRLNGQLNTLSLSTVFGSGTSVNISPTAFLVDVCDRIYVSGWGGGTNNFWNNATGNTIGLPVTSNAFQATTDGSDFYFMVLESGAASLLYSTYFGGSGTQEHVDGGTSRFNRDGVIHQAVCAGCGGSSAFPTTPGAWSNTNDAPSGCNLGVIKLDMEITGVDVEITAGSDVSGCAPFDVQFNSQLVNAADILWDFGDGTTSALAAPSHTYSTPGTYTVMLIGIDTILCTGGLFADTAYATITVNAIATPADANVDRTVCGNVAAQLGTPPVAGYTYAWSPSTGLSNASVAQPNASPSTPQTYTLTVTDANGCQDTDQVNVDVFTLQTTGAASICPEDGSVQLGASAASSWLWSPAVYLDDATLQNPMATVSTTTTFNVQADNGSGCVLNGQVTVTVFPAAVADAGQDERVCIGGSLSLSASGGVQYQWSPTTFLNDASVASPVLTPTSDISYTVEVTNSSGCTATDVVNVEVDPLPVVTATPNVEVCENAVVQLQASGAVSYSWSPATGLDDPTSVSPLATVATSTIFTVTGTDINGCVNTGTATIDVFSVVVSGDTAVCPQQSVQLTVAGGTDWTWSPANLLDDPTAQNPVTTISSPTTFTVAVSNGQGCVLVRDVFVDMFSPALANAGADQTTCEGSQVALSASGGVTYLWSPSTYLSNPNVAAPIATPLQDVTYLLTVVDANGCTDEDEVSLSVLSLPSVTVSPDEEICIGGSVQLNASGGVQYSWSPLIAIDDPNSASPVVSPSVPTVYQVVVTDANGCVDTASVSVTLFTVTANVAPDATLCANDSVLVSASGGVAFSWSPTAGVGQPDAQTTYITPAQSGVYVVTATALSGCTDTAQVELTVFSLPTAAFEASFIPTCEGVLARFTNLSQGADTYDWTFSIPPDSLNSTDASLVFPNGQGPIVTLTSTLQGTGCSTTITQDFSGQYFSNDSVEVFYPNVITPNDDGLNDCFKPGFTGAFSDCYELVVYNRWGALIFESVASGHCWDGRTKAGNLVAEGTYYYITRVFEEEHAGWVQVIID
jgi:gliding motility-associated-like protein